MLWLSPLSPGTVASIRKEKLADSCLGQLQPRKGGGEAGPWPPASDRQAFNLKVATAGHLRHLVQAVVCFTSCFSLDLRRRSFRKAHPHLCAVRTGRGGSWPRDQESSTGLSPLKKAPGWERSRGAWPCPLKWWRSIPPTLGLCSRTESHGCALSNRAGAECWSKEQEQ